MNLKPIIVNAVIKLNGMLFEGANHAQAMRRALYAGVDISNVNRWSDGYFRTSDGRIIDRVQAKEEFGINRSEDIPTQWGKPSLPTDPDPRKEFKFKFGQ